MVHLVIFPTRLFFYKSRWILSHFEQVLASFGSVGRNFFDVITQMELGNQHGEDNMFFIKWKNYSGLKFFMFFNEAIFLYAAKTYMIYLLSYA